MSGESATAREPNLRDEPVSPARLGAWLGIVGFLITISYIVNYAGHVSDKDKATSLFHYSSAVGAAVEYAILLGAMILIARPRFDLLALRPPRAWLAGLGAAILVLVVAYVGIAILDHFLHGGREQGLVPKHITHHELAPYLVNWIVVGAVAPFVEELMYRGVGFSLIADRFGARMAIFAIGILFAASHGFLQAFPELALLGWALAWLRARYDTIYLGMIVHASVNSIGLAAVFWTTH